MTTTDVSRALIAIASSAVNDPEAASYRERAMLKDVLQEIAIRGDSGSAELARAALRAWEIPFRRCA